MFLKEKVVRKLKNTNWVKFIFPFTTYYKLNYGIINPVLVIFDIMVLCIPLPFISVGIICLINYFLNGEDK